eukprot:TRINITY_DN65690_c0_g1_i1.p1 TRINITY_DN65690_c0_g1~~TRINITY_DN65690_c0_g1_i1.p1  ORF type:complete len:442 (+),score=66.70 TRINITY_DN65690_c0_g1_i1:96-1421(+)
MALPLAAFSHVSNLSASKAAKLAQRRERRGKQPAADEDLPIVDKKSSACRRFCARVQFNGAAFHGWMRQPNLRTIQEALENAARACVGQRVRLVPAGRTDSGVSALLQVVQFEAVFAGDVASSRDAEAQAVAQLVVALNAELPEDLKVMDAAVVGDDFNVLVTKWKRYTYMIRGCQESLAAFCRQTFPEAILGDDPVDVGLMREAAALLTGTHDFGAFHTRTRGKSEDRDTVRTVHRILVRRRPGGLAVVMEGEGFLTHMCRILAGTLLEVGCGLRKPQALLEAFATGERCLAGPTLPACGLCLEHVEHVRPWSEEASDELDTRKLPQLVPGVVDHLQVIAATDQQHAAVGGGAPQAGTQDAQPWGTRAGRRNKAMVPTANADALASPGLVVTNGVATTATTCCVESGLERVGPPSVKREGCLRGVTTSCMAWLRPSIKSP